MDKFDSAKLARIDEKVIGIINSFATHEKQDSDRFERSFNYMKERFDNIDAKLNTLWDDKNKQLGAFGMGRLFAGAIGGLLVAIIDYLSFGVHK